MTNVIGKIYNGKLPYNPIKLLDRVQQTRKAMDTLLKVTPLRLSSVEKAMAQSLTQYHGKKSLGRLLAYYMTMDLVHIWSHPGHTRKLREIELELKRKIAKKAKNK